jgi:hypothetical protein
LFIVHWALLSPNHLTGGLDAAGVFTLQRTGKGSRGKLLLLSCSPHRHRSELTLPGRVARFAEPSSPLLPVHSGPSVPFLSSSRGLDGVNCRRFPFNGSNAATLARFHSRFVLLC